MFFHETSTKTTQIFGEIKDLPDGEHAFHVHESVGPGYGCSVAGGHFDTDKVFKIVFFITFANFQLVFSLDSRKDRRVSREFGKD